MKTLTLLVIVMMICTLIVPPAQNAISMPDLSPQDLYKQSDMIFYGQVVSAGPGPGPDSNYYLLKTVTSFKNPQKSDYITAVGNKTGAGIQYPQFGNGDNALFYIQKINGINTISPYSQIAGNECGIHSFLGPAPLPGEPIMRGAPVPRIYISDAYGNFPEKFPVNHHIVLSSSDILNSYPEARTITIEMSILDSNEQKIFYKKQGWGYRACDGPGAMQWDFVPTQSGKYTAILVVDNKTTITTSFDVNGSNVHNAQLVLSPLQQFKSGIKAENVKCNSDLLLAIKLDYSPSCITESSAVKLFLRGWTYGFANYQPVYFMKHNMHAEISVKYSPSNHGSMSSDLLDLYPRAYSKTNSNYPTDAIYANANPDMVSPNADTVVKYTVMAQNNTRGVYWLSLDNICELVPIAVDVDESNLTISDLQSPATAWKCPGSTMQYHVIGVSGVTVGLVPIRN